MSDEAASALAKKRWDKTTPEERSESSRKLARARWGPPKKNVGRKTKKAKK